MLIHYSILLSDWNNLNVIVSHFVQLGQPFLLFLFHIYYYITYIQYIHTVLYIVNLLNFSIVQYSKRGNITLNLKSKWIHMRQAAELILWVLKFTKSQVIHLIMWVKGGVITWENWRATDGIFFSSVVCNSLVLHGMQPSGSRITKDIFIYFSWVIECEGCSVKL